MRIFLHRVGRSVTGPDTEGVEVDDPGAVRAAIAREIGELIREFPEDDRRGWQLRVADQAGEILFTVPFDTWIG